MITPSLGSVRCYPKVEKDRSASRICTGLSPLPTGRVAAYALAEWMKWTRAPDSHRVCRFCGPMARRLYLARALFNGVAAGIRTRIFWFTARDSDS